MNSSRPFSFSSILFRMLRRSFSFWTCRNKFRITFGQCILKNLSFKKVYSTVGYYFTTMI